MIKFLTALVVLLSVNIAHADLAATKIAVAKRNFDLIPYPTKDMIIDALSNFRPDLKPVFGSDFDAKAKAVLTKIDGEYRKQFPSLMKKKAFPDFVVVDSQSLTDTFAFMSYPISGTTTYRGFIAIPSELLLKTERQAALIGVLSHEMAHLMLYHTGITESVLNVTRFGKPVDAATRKTFELYLQNSEVAGPYAQAALLGMPLNDSVLLNVLSDLIHELMKNYSKQTCVQEAIKLTESASTFVQKDISLYDWQLIIPRGTESARLKDGIRDLEAKLISCSGDLGFSGGTLAKTTFSLDGKEVTSEQFISAKLKRPFHWSGQNEFEVLFALGQAVQADMRKELIAGKLNEIRWRSFEDEADEFAVSVLRGLHLSSVPLVDSFLTYFGKEQPGFTARCVNAIKRGQNIPYGFLSDPHHSTCYRVQHIHTLAADRSFHATP